MHLLPKFILVLLILGEGGLCVENIQESPTMDDGESVPNITKSELILNENSTDSNNVTESQLAEATKGTSKNSKPKKVACLKLNHTLDYLPTVQVLNSSQLPNSFQTVPNMTVAQCVLLLFYAPWCHFSAAAAPHFNAAPRLFPDISCIAVNAAVYSSLNARYGTLAIPTLLLFHNGQPVAKFNETQYTLEKFTEFVKKYTGLEPSGVVNVTSADFEGPLPSTPSQETDYFLWLAWTFLISCCIFGFMKSSLCQKMVEILRNNWQEAEAQHEHVD